MLALLYKVEMYRCFLQLSHLTKHKCSLSKGMKVSPYSPGAYRRQSKKIPGHWKKLILFSGFFCASMFELLYGVDLAITHCKLLVL